VASLLLVIVAVAVAVLRQRSRREDRVSARSAIAELAVSCATGCAVAGGLELARLVFATSTWTVDGVPLAGASLVGGLLLLALLLWSGRGAVGKGKRFGWLLLATFGALGFCLALLRDANIEFDFHPAVTRETRVVNLTSSTTLRGGTSHFMRLADWTHEGAARELDISRDQSRSYGIGQMVAFEEHPGALGFRWIGGLRAAAVSERPVAPRPAASPAAAGPRTSPAP